MIKLIESSFLIKRIDYMFRLGNIVPHRLLCLRKCFMKTIG